MQIQIRFLAISSKLTGEYRPFSLPEGSTADALLSAVETAGRSGAFCAPDDWPGLPKRALIAADERMLRPGDALREGQLVSVIGPLIGG